MADVVKKACDVKIRRGSKKVACGKDVPNNEPTSVTIGTTKYVMDLCEEHQGALMSALEPYTSVASDVLQRRGNVVRKAIQGKRGAFTTKDVRNWLKQQGREVTETGRLPNDLIQEYVEAHQ
ncbi:histone-like nucleoid-structuring protein Lsr2 [Streptomyces sp. NPDC058252]|uniref:Lsr2 family DNA-binding protein n=1 Tax=Streptomyces sp. NPDC058252 TaxID=3346405 RepID=UPI0036EF2C43